MNNAKNTSSVQRSKESQVEDFDLVILGGGTGSTVAAWTFAGEGQRVAVIDRQSAGHSISFVQSSNGIKSAGVHPLGNARIS
jgi:flavin-dependent dehydrogenase